MIEVKNCVENSIKNKQNYYFNPYLPAKIARKAK